MKKLFAMLLALTMTFQLITPAWADAAEAPEEITEASDVVEEVEEEIPETTEEDVPEETEEETTEATEETLPEEKPAPEETEAPTEAEKYRVTFACIPEDLTLVVYPKDADIDQAIEPEEDGSYLLEAGEYAYLAAAEGYESKQSAISVTGNTEKVEIVLLSTLDSGAVSEYASDCVHSNLTFFKGFPATMQYNGVRAYWRCTDCDKYFRDDNGQPGKELTEADAVDEKSDYGAQSFLVIPRLPLVSSGTTSDGFTWSIDDEGVLRISGIGKMRDYVNDNGCYDTRNQIPEWYQYQKITQMRVTKLILSDGITSIGEKAFSDMEHLTEVCLPDTLTEINYAAFRCCRNLENVKIPKNVAKIGAYAFEGCKSLTSIVIPNGVSEIESSTFVRCTNLKDIYIPQSVTNIVDMAFSYAGATGTEIHDVYYEGTAEDWAKVSGRSQLSDATIHYEAHIHSLTHNQRKEAACDECGSPEYWHCEGCQKNFGEAECINELQEEQLVFPALGHNLAKTEAVAPTHTAPGNNEYYTCSRCGKVYKDADGKTETTVEAETLEQLPGIASGTCGENVNWVLTEDGTLTISGNGKMKDYDDGVNTAPWYTYRKSIVAVLVESGVQSVGDYAFYACYKLKTVQIKLGVSEIGYRAFKDCSMLKTVDLPETMDRISVGAFYSCGSLTDITIPKGIKTISGNFFMDCTSLEQVIIPEGVTEIGVAAFGGCCNLINIVIPDGVVTIDASAFSYCSSLTKLDIPKSVRKIGDGAFYQCTNLESITIPEGVTKLEYNLFSGCKQLKKVVIPESVTIIDYQVFEECNNLDDVVIPEGVTGVGYRAFFNCSSLTHIEIPDGASLAGAAFEGCSNLVSANIPGSAKSIGERTFNGCIKLESIDIPDGVTSIGSEAFRKCGNLTTISIPKGVTRIEELTFAECSSLKKVDIPEGVVSIERGAFARCESLTNINIPENVTSIEDQAFSGCSSLKSVSIPENVTRIGVNAFCECSRMESIYIPKAVATIGDTCFTSSTLKDIYYGGSDLDWEKVKIGVSNWGLYNATIHYNSIHICELVPTPATAPTCTEPGNNAYYTCKLCQKVYQDEQGLQETTVEAETLPALGHSMEKTEARAATCTEDGNNEYFTCATCHKIFKDAQGNKETTAAAEILPALGHVMVRVETTAPTCTGKGNRVYYRCETCGKSFKDKAGLEATTPEAEAVAALGHTMVKTEAVAPTCTESGSNAYYTCDTCHKVFKDAAGKQETTPDAEILAPLGHTMKKTAAKAATCTEPGNHLYYTCITCGIVFQDDQGEKQTTVDAETVPALGHSMEETPAVAPTCTEGGNNAYFTCATCHKVYKDAEGKQETTVKAETLAALGHHMILTVAVAPTCTESGNRAYYTCSTCQGIYKDWSGSEATTADAEVLPALGHRMTETPAKAATCTTSGNNAYFTCGTCHKVYKDADGQQETTKEAEILPALGHTMTETAAKEATCTASGNNAYFTCATCHLVFKDGEGKQKTTVAAETLKALGHKMTKTAAKAATCTEDGNNVYFTCSTCHKIYKDQQGTQETTVQAETLKALGHSMMETHAKAATCTESGNNTYFTCGTCHKIYKDRLGTEETTVKEETLLALGHTMAKTEAKEPTCTASGNNAYYTCETCHQVFKDELGQRRTTVSAEKLSAFGHTMKKTPAKEATCTESGNNLYYTCITCGIVFQDDQGEKQTTVEAETIPALGHTMQETPAVAPTCTEGGNNAYFTCETCHKVFKDTEGKRETTVKAETLVALGHAMVLTEAVAPTCTESGNNAYYTCATCHKVYKDVDGKTETTVEAEQLPRLPGLAHGASGSLNWFLSEEEVLTVSGNGRMPDYSGNDLAPWYAFRGKIQKVILEEGVQTVGSYAFFDCNMLTEVELPQSVTKLGKSCFDGCGQLKLLSLEKVPAELTQKVTDLNGLATLAEPISSLVGNRASYHWSLETVRGENQASDLAKLDGTKLEVIHSGKFYLVCEEDYTGLSAALEVGAKTSTEIRPDTEQLASGESLTLSAWAMPFDTRLSAKWTLDQESEAYAGITADGTLTAKAVTAPVQITVKAVPVNGEEAAEKTLWILPKTTGLGILADGHLAGETLTVDLTETRELTLSAQIQPQGAGTKVTWTSSREDVAVIDETGKVILLKPGKTVLRAETQDGSGIATELALTVRYLDSAETLTLTAQIPETGLEPGMTAKLTLSGENAIDPEKVEFYISESQAAIAIVDETGLLTAGTTPGTVTVTAALKDDPLMRKAQLTLTVNPMLNHALRLESNIPEGLGYVDGNMFYGEIAGIAGQNRSFALKVQGQDYLGSWAEAKNVTYTSSNPAIAAVDASGTVSLTAKEEGTCVITVRCTDALEAEAQLTIVLQNSAPRLGATTVTLNSNSTQGADVDLVASYGNTVDTVTVYDYNKSTKIYALSTLFTAEAEEGTLTLYSQNVLKNGTYPVKLEVACRTGVYTFTMNVKVANILPKVTVKQTAKLNLFYKNSTAPLAVTAPGQTVTDMTLTDTADFTLMPGEEGWEIVYSSENAKPDTKGTLNVYLDGYQEPVKVNLTVGTVTTAPAVKLSAASSTLNTGLNSEYATRVMLLDKAGQPLELENPTVESSNADVSVNGSLLTITLNEAKSTTVTMYLQDSTWARSIKLTHKITVSNKLPTLKPVGNLTLNSLFTQRVAETAMVLSQSNVSLDDVTFVSTAKEGSAAWTEAQKLELSYDSGYVTAQIVDAENAPKAGTYSFKCTGTLEDNVQIPGGTLKVTVSAAAPKVKLSATSVKLNQYLAGEEQGTVAVTAPNGYQVVDLDGKRDGMAFDADTGILTVTLQNASDNGGICTLYPVVWDAEADETVTLPTKLIFKVQAYNSSKLSVSVSAKGKLDTQTDGEITYTVTKLANCLGMVDNMVLEGQDAGLFQADMDFVNGKPTVHLTLKEGESYFTNKAYKVQFRFYACGREILSPVQTVKVTQTALKVIAPKTITYYQAQKSPLRVVLTTNVPLDEVELNRKTTAKEFQLALGEMTLEDSRVVFTITNPGALTAGKSYTVALDATPENNAENAKPVAVRLTVKVQK